MDNATAMLTSIVLAYGICRWFPWIGTSYNIRSLASVLTHNMFGKFVMYKLDGRPYRLVCHKLPVDVTSVTAVGHSSHGEEKLHIEYIRYDTIVGLPMRPSDVDYDSIVVSFVREKEGDIDHKHDMTMMMFNKHDTITLVDRARKREYVSIDDSDDSLDG